MRRATALSSVAASVRASEPVNGNPEKLADGCGNGLAAPPAGAFRDVEYEIEAPVFQPPRELRVRRHWHRVDTHSSQRIRDRDDGFGLVVLLERVVGRTRVVIRPGIVEDRDSHRSRTL